MNLTEKLKNYIDTINISEYGFADISGIKTGELLENEPSAKNLHTGISIVIKLSPAVLEGISDKPTHSYFHHYRTVNAHIDASLLKIGMFLDSHGYRYYPIPASQSINGFQGVFQHKTVARLAGLGYIGKNAMFISDKLGIGIRLGTLLTDAPLDTCNEISGGSCGSCNICTSVCPAMAIYGENFNPQKPDAALIDRKVCSDYMKDKFQNIGRGVVCGICMRNCPKFKI
ncbi:MAG: epoxyqueuosine reductase [Clostridia bacterium]|nr:epoxyqueuosine reductase [Clostridia bacterium]